jgi:hypothetical protein
MKITFRSPRRWQKYSKLQIKILFERADAVEKMARKARAKLHSNIQKNFEF